MRGRGRRRERKREIGQKLFSQSKIKKLHTLYVICNYVIIMPVSSTGLYGLGDFAAKIIYTIILYE